MTPHKRTLALSDDILMRVEKPARYIGGEVNAVMKDPHEVEIRFAFCFPDVYEIGMSHLGIQILYDMLNSWEDVWCERVYSPWRDLDHIMRKEEIPLFALESQDPVKNFDFLGITIQYEMCYTNILQVLDLAQIPLNAAERGEDCPIVIGGGPCTYNPEPLADFFDLFYIGEGETQYRNLLNLYSECRREHAGRREFLRRAAKLPGIYAPSFYEVTYGENGVIKSFLPIEEGIPATVTKEIQMDVTNTYYPMKPVVPFIKVTQDRVVLEIQRGCIRGCRFCQAGFIYRPLREKNPGTLVEEGKSLCGSTGYEDISLSSLSTSDYSKLEELLNRLIEYTDDQKISMSLPSLRIDNFSEELLNRIKSVRKSGLTFAPEAGTQRLRDVINKNITEKDVLRSCALAFAGGYTTVKLYFMLGLPTEMDEDIRGITELARKVVDLFYSMPSRPKGKVSVSVSCATFVPKPHTPFQYEPQITGEEIAHKQDVLVKSNTNRRIEVHYHHSDTSLLEGVFARGDRRLGKVLLRAFEKGCRFDSWDETFRFPLWEEAFAECGLDPAFYANRTRSFEEILPWSHLDYGITEEFLQRENRRAHEAVPTPNCRQQCAGCGIQALMGGACFGK